MEDILPKFVVIQSIVSKGNALYSTEQAPKYIYTQCEDVFNPYVKIEVEIAKINRKYVHLRFYHSNRYWARCADNNWIIAVSNQPDEDTCKSSCTLFEPTIDNDGHLHFTHVQSKRRVRIDSCSTRIRVDDAGDCQTCREHAFSFLDWDKLVKIPKHVSFKGDNCLYLTAFPNGFNCLAFTSLSCKDTTTAYEVTVRPDGYLRIKSVFYNMYLRPSTLTTSLFMVADLSGHCSGEKDDLFWPVPIKDHTIALRNAGNNKYCNRHPTLNFLQTGVDCINKYAELVVEERVCERKICNVEYRMEDARVYDELLFVAGTGTAVNESDQESTMTISFTYDHTQSSCFTASTQCAFVGANSIIEAVIPGIACGKIEVSEACVTNTLNWGSTTVENKTELVTYTAKVPRKSRVTINYVGTQGKCSVPFSYTQQDKYSADDEVVTCRQIDGVFQGVNSYNFNFEELPVESL